MRRRQMWSHFKKWFQNVIRDENLYFRFFALFLAIILWFLAGGVIRFASVERTITIPIQVRNIPKDFALIDEPEQVKISVRSLSPLMAIAERDAQATVDLSNAIEGAGTYGVDVSVPAGVEIVNVSPRWVRLSTERIIEKDFSVFIAALGLNPEQLFKSHLPNTKVVRVRAPQSKLDKVSQVVAYVGLVYGANRIEGTFPIKALGEKGQILEGISFFPTDIRVILETVTIETPPSNEELFTEEELESSEESIQMESDDQLEDESMEESLDDQVEKPVEEPIEESEEKIPEIEKPDQPEESEELEESLLPSNSGENKELLWIRILEGDIDSNGQIVWNGWR